MQPAIRNFALLLTGCVLFHIAGTWSVPLIDRDEPRFAEASREMRERRDYIIPYFNNRYRFDKPPFTYWCQVVSFNVLGENDFAARFPSTIAAALTALSVFTWGLRIGGRNLAWWAAIIFTLSLQTFIHAKAAVADMWLVLFVTLAHWAGWELLFGEAKSKRPTLNAQHPTSNEIHAAPDSAWWWVFYVALALAFLAKGPIGWTPLATMVISRLFFRANTNAQFSFIRGTIVTLAGILLMLGIISIWAIPALIQTNGEFFRVGIGRHVIERSIATMEGHGAGSFITYVLLLPFYFLTIFVSFFPWSIKLPALVRDLWEKRDQTDRYLIAGSIIVFAIFTLVRTKLPHYTLPAFSLLSLLLARNLIARNATQFLKRCAIATTTVYLAIALLAPLFVAHLFPARELFRQARDHLRPEMEFGAVDFTEPSLVWYFRGRAKGFLTTLKERRAPDFMSKSGPRFVIVPTPMAEMLFANHPEEWKFFRARGFNLVKGKPVDLTLVLKP